MKILKKLFLILICNVFFLNGCKKNSTEVEAPVFQRHNRVISIYDINNNEIGKLTCMGYSALINDNILYSKFSKINSEQNSSVEYWLYNINDKSNTYLGIVDDYNYEATHETTVYNDHVY